MANANPSMPSNLIRMSMPQSIATTFDQIKADLADSHALVRTAFAALTIDDELGLNTICSLSRLAQEKVDHARNIWGELEFRVSNLNLTDGQKDDQGNLCIGMDNAAAYYALLSESGTNARGIESLFLIARNLSAELLAISEDMGNWMSKLPDRC